MSINCTFPPKHYVITLQNMFLQPLYD